MIKKEISDKMMGYTIPVLILVMFCYMAQPYFFESKRVYDERMADLQAAMLISVGYGLVAMAAIFLVKYGDGKVDKDERVIVLNSGVAVAAGVAIFLLISRFVSRKAFHPDPGEGCIYEFSESFLLAFFVITAVFSAGYFLLMKLWVEKDSAKKEGKTENKGGEDKKDGKDKEGGTPQPPKPKQGG